MSLFDLLFVLLCLVAIGAMLRALFLALNGKSSRAVQTLRHLCVGVGVYLLLVMAVSMVLPRRTLRVGDPICFDDWCMAVQNVTTKEMGASVSYRIDFRLSSRAQRAPQREKDLAVYMTGDGGERFEPVPSGSMTPFDEALKPGESISATRFFMVPRKLNNPGVVVTHEGGFPISWLIIGYETWFRKPTIVLVQSRRGPPLPSSDC